MLYSKTVHMLLTSNILCGETFLYEGEFEFPQVIHISNVNVFVIFFFNITSSVLISGSTYSDVFGRIFPGGINLGFLAECSNS